MFGLAFKDSVIGLPLLEDIGIIKSIRGLLHFVCLSRPLEGPIQVAVYLADDPDPGSKSSKENKTSTWFSLHIFSTVSHER